MVQLVRPALLARDLGQEGGDLRRVVCSEDVPHRAPALPMAPQPLKFAKPQHTPFVLARVTVVGRLFLTTHRRARTRYVALRVHKDVHCVGHVAMQRGGPHLGRVVVCKGAVGNVHLRAEVGRKRIARKARDEVERPVAPRVLRVRQRLHQIGEMSRELVGEVIRRRPVLQLEKHFLAAAAGLGLRLGQRPAAVALRRPARHRARLGAAEPVEKGRKRA
mmetsp:Transcript_61705/g.102624  ORF Transcript_61705/g.102624 Transcript_61705/m.102624 type:complete len:219 (+) Transcript_61705:585-1241(+)